jgi:hypothetical protein
MKSCRCTCKLKPGWPWEKQDSIRRRIEIKIKEINNEMLHLKKSFVCMVKAL